jgi:hypothetical protein
VDTAKTWLEFSEPASSDETKAIFLITILSYPYGLDGLLIIIFIIILVKDLPKASFLVITIIG